MTAKKRKRWSAEEKLRIVLAGLEGDIEVSELCHRGLPTELRSQSLFALR